MIPRAVIELSIAASSIDMAALPAAILAAGT
jgi:hypothetical protein